jgi:sugar/nucleoside kinase (ribokinase family)
MKVLGIGNALVDILTQLNKESDLENLNLPKGSMTLVDREMSNFILAETSGLLRKKASGGSAANTIHGLAHLGIKTAFIGKIGSDELGKFFKRDMQVNNIFTILYNSVNDTGRAIALVTPDSERTFATYLGAAVELAAEDLTADIFEGYDIFYVEGYLVQNKELLEKAFRLAKSAGLTTCMDLASYNVVYEHKEVLESLIEQYVDIVFANEEEAKALTSLEPEGAINIIASKCSIAVIKIGSKGSIIKKGDQIVKVPAITVTSIDTTGAGDLYAAGFLYGLSMDASLETCGRIGSLLGGKVIEIIGAKMEESSWELIRRQVSKETVGK